MEINSQVNTFIGGMNIDSDITMLADNQYRSVSYTHLDVYKRQNRYRGIENPFGHIWKHTDDIISIYGGGYRTWYKSIKPRCV